MVIIRGAVFFYYGIPVKIKGLIHVLQKSDNVLWDNNIDIGPTKIYR